jgi:ATP-dependent Clp protease ATP-binding subunit ClpA
VLQRLVLNELSKAILSGSIKKDSAVLIEYRGGELVFENVVKVEEVG